MGTFLKVAGIIVLILGIIFTITLLGAPVGIPMIINGITLFALGTIYNDVREIKEKLR
jgi:hypothetical protein